jgi:hypothetical protein
MYMFPALKNIASTPRGRHVSIITVVGIRHFLVSLIVLLRVLFFFSPAFLKTVVTSLTNLDDHNASIVLDKLLHVRPMLAASTLGAWEMVEVNDLDFDFMDKHVDKMAFIYGKHDEYAFL